MYCCRAEKESNRKEQQDAEVLDTLNDTLNDSVRATYTIIRLNPGLQRKSIPNTLGKSVATISRHIAILMKAGLIEHRDSDKTRGNYVK